jgi:phosphatidylserine/phosphatidylglycerophosphate/cardiolipin synthase-like enzyme
MSSHVGIKKNLLSAAVLLFSILQLPTLVFGSDAASYGAVNPSINELVSDIDHSRQSVIVSIYSILQPGLAKTSSNKDHPVLAALVRAKQRGVAVSLLLNSFDESSRYIDTLLQQRERQWCQQQHMTCYWSSAAFSHSHQKIILIDGRMGYILTGNLPWCWASSVCAVNYAYKITNPAIISYLIQLYYSDLWNSRHHARFTPKAIPTDLVVSPLNSSKVISEFIRKTQNTLDIEQPFLTNKKHIPRHILLALQSVLDRGVVVRIITSVTKSQKHPHLNADLKKLQSQYPNLQIRISPSSQFVHAKVLLQDSSRLLIGSVNWSYSAFYHNREVSIILSNKAATGALLRDFSKLWQKSRKMT